MEATDRWRAEEEQMRKEFMQLRKNSDPPPQKHNLVVPKKRNTDNNSHKIDSKRGLQLPPISKTCTEPNDPVVPCPPPNLAQICDKYNGGDFESCFQACKPSVCCTHDSRRQSSLSCADTAVNCEHWIPCYIIWWKLSDTIGPATFLRMIQSDDFFNVDFQYIRDDYNDPENTVFYVSIFISLLFYFCSVFRVEDSFINNDHTNAHTGTMVSTFY